MTATNKRGYWILVLALVLSLGLTRAVFSQEGVNLVFNDFKYDAFPELKATITVINNSGIPYQGLKSADFQADEESKQVKINSVAEKVNPAVPIAVALVLDGSGSMATNNFTPWKQAKESAITFLRALEAKDEAALVVFGDEVNTNEPILNNIDPVKEANFTADKQKLITQIENLPDPVPGVTTTPLYDGAYKAVRIAAQKDPRIQRTVILFTDGKEGRETGELVSKLSQDAAISEAQNKHIPVFSIRLGDLPDVEYLRRLAVVTGGDYFEATEAAGLVKVYKDIADRLKTQYDLTFTSNLRCDNKEHKLGIKVRTGDGETVNAETFTALCPETPGIQLFYAKPSDIVGGQPTQEPLPDGFEVPKTEAYQVFTIIPLISTRYTIKRVEYFVDDATQPSFSVTNAPFSYQWDTTKLNPATHKMRVVVYDNESPPHQGEKTITLTSGWVVQGDIPPIWIWVIVILLIVIIIIATALYLRHRRSQQAVAAGGYVMDVTVQPVQPLGQGPFFNPSTGGATGTAAPIAAVPLTTAGPMPGVRPGQPAAGGFLPHTQWLDSPPNTPAFLVMEEGNRPGQFYPLSEQNTLGRDGTQCDVVIDDGSISRRHARIKQQGKGAFYIYDLAATNPIRVNGQETSGMKLEDGDKIELGRVRLVFKQVK